MARSFNTTGDFIDFGDTLNIIGTAISIYSWQWRPDSTRFDWILHRSTPVSAAETQWILSRQGTANLGARFGFWTAGAFVNIFNDVVHASNSDTANWHHWAATYDGANAKLYVDGVLAHTVAETRSIQAITAPGVVQTQRIAANNGGSRVAYLGIHNVALTATEILEAKSSGTTARGRLGQWKMDTANATETDLSGNGNHGTATGTTLFTPDAPIGRAISFGVIIT